MVFPARPAAEEQRRDRARRRDLRRPRGMARRGLSRADCREQGWHVLAGRGQEQTLCGSQCADNKQSTSVCSGTGDGIVGTITSCNNLLWADAATCKTACANAGDCLAGFSCDKGACVSGTICLDDHTAP